MARSDDTAPATKGDIKGLRTELKGDIKALRGEVIQFKEEIIHHFDIVAENLRHDVLGAHSDQMELTKDKLINHEGRIQILEMRAA